MKLNIVSQRRFKTFHIMKQDFYMGSKFI